MKASEAEKLICGALLRNSDDETGELLRVVNTLTPDKFDPKGVEGKIYRAIAQVVKRRDEPNIAAVALELGDKLAGVGGEEYLRQLFGVPKLHGVGKLTGLDAAVRYVDKVGVLRQIAEQVESYGQALHDIEAAAQSVDVDDLVTGISVDINTILMRTGKADFIHISELMSLDFDRLTRQVAGEVVDYIPSGIPGLEGHGIPCPGELTILTALSSVGKTSLSMWWALGTAKKLKEQGLPGCVAYSSLETGRATVARRFGLHNTRLRNVDIIDDQTDAHARYIEAYKDLVELPIYVDDSASVTISQLQRRALQLHLVHGPLVLHFVDFLELVDNPGETMEREITGITKGVRDIAWETGAAEVLLAQMNAKALKDSTKLGADPDTLKGASSIYQYARAVGILYNPLAMTALGLDFAVPSGWNPERAHLVLTKNKEGKPGRYDGLEWIPGSMTFRDVHVPEGYLFMPPPAQHF
jgi:replicative DNA helicase